MSKKTDIELKIHQLSTKLWISQNYDYVTRMNKIRARINHRKTAIPKLEARINQYVKDLESDMLEIANNERGHKPKDKTGWSTACTKSYHCNTKSRKSCKTIFCKCWCHNA